MQKQLTFHEKTIEITLSESALRQSQKLNCILLIEIQIYFSCLLGKRLAFYTEQAQQGAWQVEPELFKEMLGDAQALSENLYIRFNTVMTKDCPVGDYIGPPPVTDFKITNQKPYVPSWLKLAYKNDSWSGEYGWKSSQKGQSNTKQVRGQALSTQM